MIQITDLINRNSEYGLYHGTRANITDKLEAGSKVLGQASSVIKLIWDAIAIETARPIDDIFSDNVLEFFPTSSHARKNTLELGNSIRYLRGNFVYSGVCFAFNRFGADGYAKEGSELAAAILATISASAEEYPRLFNTYGIQDAIASAKTVAETVNSAPGKVLRLVKLPDHGFFWSLDHADKRITAVRTHPVSGHIALGEIFFSESIPIDHFEIVSIH